MPNWIYCLIKEQLSSINLKHSEEKFSITTTNCIINKATIHPYKTKERRSFEKCKCFVYEDFKVEAENLERYCVLKWSTRFSKVKSNLSLDIGKSASHWQLFCIYLSKIGCTCYDSTHFQNFNSWTYQSKIKLILFLSSFIKVCIKSYAGLKFGTVIQNQVRNVS